MRTLILSYIIQNVISNVCTKSQEPMCSSSCEIFDGIKFTDRHTENHCYLKDKKYIPSIYSYFICQGYNKLGLDDINSVP